MYPIPGNPPITGERPINGYAPNGIPGAASPGANAETPYGLIKGTPKDVG